MTTKVAGCEEDATEDLLQHAARALAKKTIMKYARPYRLRLSG